MLHLTRAFPNVISVGGGLRINVSQYDEKDVVYYVTYDIQRTEEQTQMLNVIHLSSEKPEATGFR